MAFVIGGTSPRRRACRVAACIAIARPIGVSASRGKAAAIRVDARAAQAVLAARIQWKPMGASSWVRRKRHTHATDLLVEKDPEVEPRGKRRDGDIECAAARQRREGRSGGDIATAARKGNAPEGVAPSGTARCKALRNSQRDEQSPRRGRRDVDPDQKHGEPHGRLRGAIDSRGTLRRKPSESCETARTERTSSLATRRRRSSSGWSGSGREVLVYGGGAIFDESQERSSKAFNPVRERKAGE